jgi:DNA-binding NarL/FixJ family response regulator
MNATTATLHKREVLLLERLSHGLSDERIGEEMHLSAEAVRANIRGVVRTLGARNREHAVAIALKSGLIQ